MSDPMALASLEFSQAERGVALMVSDLLPSVIPPKVCSHSFRSITPSFLISIVSKRSLIIA